MGITLSTAAIGSTSGWADYGSTEIWSTAGIASSRHETTQSAANLQQQQLMAMLGQPGLGSSSQLKPGDTFTVANTVTPVKKGLSMGEEFKSYIREYKDWIFTIAIIAIIDHFFLDGALKEKLSAALGKKLDDGKA